MKKIIFNIALVLTASIALGDTGYWYRGQRIALETSAKTATLAVKEAGKWIYSTVEAEEETGDEFLRRAKTIADGNNAVVLPYIKLGDKECFMSNFINVKLKSASDEGLLKKALSDLGMEYVNQNKFMPLWHTVSISCRNRMNTLEAADKLYETGAFAAVEPDINSVELSCSYDPMFKEQWGLYNFIHEDIDIDACSAWNYATGRGIKIAIIDTGVDRNHPDLAANMYPVSYDTETGEEKDTLYLDHGTHVAGIAAAVRNNGIGIAGVAPDATIMSVAACLLDSAYAVNIGAKLANGINWATINGAEVLNCSWCIGIKSRLLEEAIDNAIENGRDGLGCAIVFSASNHGDNPLGDLIITEEKRYKNVFSATQTYSKDFSNVAYPASYRDEIIVVGSIDTNGCRSDFSSFGKEIDIVAPGRNIYSTTPPQEIIYSLIDNGSDVYSLFPQYPELFHTYMNGTSMAAPHVAGIIAMMLERNSSLLLSELTTILLNSADKIQTENGYTEDYEAHPYGTWNRKLGYGLANAYRTVKRTPKNH